MEERDGIPHHLIDIVEPEIDYSVADFYDDARDKIYEIILDKHEDQSEPNWNSIDYWGWLDFDDNEYKIIYPNYKLFHCCFPYGVQVEEKSGKGKAVRLKLVSYEKYNQMD